MDPRAEDPEERAAAREAVSARRARGRRARRRRTGSVFMLREVEQLSTADTAAALGIGEEAVKVRLHRARAMLRRDPRRDRSRAPRPRRSRSSRRGATGWWSG